MGKIFELEMANEVVRAELLSNEAPQTCMAFERAMPTRTFAVNAKFAGDETIAMLPFYAPPGENEVPSVEPGDIGYYPRSQTLCLFYGEIMPFAYINLFARVIPEDLPKAVAAGNRILNKGSLPASVRGQLAGASWTITSYRQPDGRQPKDRNGRHLGNRAR